MLTQVVSAFGHLSDINLRCSLRNFEDLMISHGHDGLLEESRYHFTCGVVTTANTASVVNFVRAQYLIASEAL